MIVGFAFTWGALFGFGFPFGCAWPEIDDLMRGRSASPDPLAALDSGDLGAGRFERLIETAIGRKGAGETEFDIERDFIEHASLRTPHFWRYGVDGLVAIDKSLALDAVNGPISMADYLAADYARLFRFAITHNGISHACVIIVVQHRSGEDFYFRHVFRSLFGFGPLWGLTIGGGGWSF